MAAGIENPYQIPQDVLVGRNNARNNINAIEAEINEIEVELQVENESITE